jgi:hypothetical protein
VKELIEYIARSLVDDPSQVHVSAQESGSSVMVELQVAREDMGRVIGRGGSVASAMRLLLRVAAMKSGKRANLEVVEPQ